MKRWKPIALCVLLAGLLTTMLLALLSLRGPAWQGRNVESWVEDFRLIGGDGHKRAVEAIRAMGTNSIPALMDLLRAEDSGFKSSLKEWMPSILIPKSAELPASVHHWRAQTGLEALGPLAVPALLELSSETNVALRAEEVLIQIGAEGIPTLMAVLTNRSSQFRVEATRALGLLGHQADMAVPMLLIGLKDQDKEIRDVSATALCLVSRNEAHVIFGWPETSSPPQEVQEPR